MLGEHNTQTGLTRQLNRRAAFNMEQLFHKMFKDQRFTPEHKFDGSTELFKLTLSDIELIKTFRGNFNG